MWYRDELRQRFDEQDRQMRKSQLRSLMLLYLTAGCAGWVLGLLLCMFIPKTSAPQSQVIVINLPAQGAPDTAFEGDRK